MSQERTREEIPPQAFSSPKRAFDQSQLWMFVDDAADSTMQEKLHSTGLRNNLDLSSLQVQRQTEAILEEDEDETPKYTLRELLCKKASVGQLKGDPRTTKLLDSKVKKPDGYFLPTEPIDKNTERVKLQLKGESLTNLHAPLQNKSTTGGSSDQYTTEKKPLMFTDRKYSLFTDMSSSSGAVISSTSKATTLLSKAPSTRVSKIRETSGRSSHRVLTVSSTSPLLQLQSTKPSLTLTLGRKALSSIGWVNDGSTDNLIGPKNGQRRQRQNAFIEQPEISCSDSRLHRPPNKKNLRVSEEDSKEFMLIPDKTIEDGRTTLYVKNIPNKYTRAMMLELFDKNYSGTYDFFYLPIDCKNKCNVGYAFINFTKLDKIKQFYNEFNNKKWQHFNSNKVCEIKYGRLQGLKELKEHFKHSNVMNQQDSNIKPYLPQRADILQLIEQQKKQRQNED